MGGGGGNELELRHDTILESFELLYMHTTPGNEGNQVRSLHNSKYNQVRSSMVQYLVLVCTYLYIKSCTQLAKMSFDEIFDLTAGVCFYFYNMPRVVQQRGTNEISMHLPCADPPRAHPLQKWANSGTQLKDKKYFYSFTLSCYYTWCSTQQ